eukprot:5640327-Amphidinium_carterae.1
MYGGSLTFSTFKALGRIVLLRGKWTECSRKWVTHLSSQVCACISAWRTTSPRTLEAGVRHSPLSIGRPKLSLLVFFVVFLQAWELGWERKGRVRFALVSADSLARFVQQINAGMIGQGLDTHDAGCYGKG